MDPIFINSKPSNSSLITKKKRKKEKKKNSPTTANILDSEGNFIGKYLKEKQITGKKKRVPV